MKACLDRYPEHRESLQPLLEVTQALEQHRAEPAPSPYFVVDLKAKLSEGTNKKPEGR